MAPYIDEETSKALGQLYVSDAFTRYESYVEDWQKFKSNISGLIPELFNEYLPNREEYIGLTEERYERLKSLQKDIENSENVEILMKHFLSGFLDDCFRKTLKAPSSESVASEEETELSDDDETVAVAPENETE